MKRRILTFSDWYLPDSKGGGTATALANLIELLGNDYDFYVLTRDRDWGDAHPYQGVPADRWVRNGKAQVFYSSRVTLRNLLRRIRETRPAVIYCNSFFSRFTIWTLLLRRLGLAPRVSVILAPRGEFFPSALEIKPRRKRIYQSIASLLGLWRNVIWQASSALEQERIASVLESYGGAGQATIVSSPDVPDPKMTRLSCFGERPEKLPGAVRLVFLSRIGPQKNPLFLLELLSGVEGEIQLDLCGPVDDPGYWDRCRQQICALPGNIRVEYRGPAPTAQVMQIFATHHFQVLPTLGENFGYVTLEALAAGCPVMTSDRSPWRNLELAGAGWDLPLEARDRWITALKICVEMDQNAYRQMSQRARAFFEEWVRAASFREEALKLFAVALGRSSSPTLRAIPK